MRLETVVLPDNGPVTPVVEGLEAMLWAGGLPAAAPLTPATDWQGLAPPRFREVQSVPTAPVFLLREGRMRGLRLGVIAVSPLYIEDGVPKIALAGRATIPGARALTTTGATGMTSAANQGAAPLSVLDRSTFTNQPVPLSPPIRP
jgi:hypothetical protein